MTGATLAWDQSKRSANDLIVSGLQIRIVAKSLRNHEVVEKPSSFFLLSFLIASQPRRAKKTASCKAISPASGTVCWIASCAASGTAGCIRSIFTVQIRIVSFFLILRRWMLSGGLCSAARPAADGLACVGHLLHCRWGLACLHAWLGCLLSCSLTALPEL